MSDVIPTSVFVWLRSGIYSGLAVVETFTPVIVLFIVFITLAIPFIIGPKDGE